MAADFKTGRAAVEDLHPYFYRMDNRPFSFADRRKLGNYYPALLLGSWGHDRQELHPPSSRASSHRRCHPI
jgi:hypothetical protein